jgi:hypothetical protein
MTEILHLPIIPTTPQLEMEGGNPVSPLMTIEPSLKWPIYICSSPVSFHNYDLTKLINFVRENFFFNLCNVLSKRAATTKETTVASVIAYANERGLGIAV